MQYVLVRQVTGTWIIQYRYSATVLYCSTVTVLLYYTVTLQQYEKSIKLFGISGCTARYALMYYSVHRYHTISSPGRNAGMVQYDEPWLWSSP